MAIVGALMTRAHLKQMNMSSFKLAPPIIPPCHSQDSVCYRAECIQAADLFISPWHPSVSSNGLVGGTQQLEYSSVGILMLCRSAEHLVTMVEKADRLLSTEELAW